MAAVPSAIPFRCSTVFFCNRSFFSTASSLSPLHSRTPTLPRFCAQGRIRSQKISQEGAFPFLEDTSCSSLSNKLLSTIPRCSDSSNISSDKGETSDQEKIPFGYTRKDVLLIGLGLTIAGIGLKTGLEYLGVDPLQAGNVVQLVLVLGLTVGWISTYIFRVSNKEMTYAQQLRDYEDKVMQKRLESLTEAEIAALLEQVEEEKTQLQPPDGQQVK